MLWTSRYADVSTDFHHIPLLPFTAFVVPNTVRSLLVSQFQDGPRGGRATVLRVSSIVVLGGGVVVSGMYIGRGLSAPIEYGCDIIEPPSLYISVSPTTTFVHSSTRRGPEHVSADCRPQLREKVSAATLIRIDVHACPHVTVVASRPCSPAREHKGSPIPADPEQRSPYGIVYAGCRCDATLPGTLPLRVLVG